MQVLTCARHYVVGPGISMAGHGSQRCGCLLQYVVIALGRLDGSCRWALVVAIGAGHAGSFAVIQKGIRGVAEQLDGSTPGCCLLVASATSCTTPTLLQHRLLPLAAMAGPGLTHAQVSRRDVTELNNARYTPIHVCRVHYGQANLFWRAASSRCVRMH